MPDDASQPVITRFAPSPTGALHVGGARTALYNWAFAKGRGGPGSRFLLRIEDTDRARSSDDSTRAILRDLRWLGLDWDEGPVCLDDWRSYDASFDPDDPANTLDPRGVGPFYQSKRLDLYNEQFQKLLDAGLAYEDEAGGGALRFKMPDRDITVIDEVLGEVTVPAGQTEDFVIRKGESGGLMPTYHFAVVVDDALMGVTHVIRGQEHLSNAPKHVALYDALGFDKPTYAHIPLIFNPDGSKMSKRVKAKVARKAAIDAGLNDNGLPSAGIPNDELRAFLSKDNDDLTVARAIARQLRLALPEIDVADFRESGYLPTALLNYLALLGWNPGDDIETFDLAFLRDKFDLDRAGKSNAKFDREKLFRFNADAIAALDPAVFRDQLHEHFAARHPRFLDLMNDNAFAAFAEAYRPRARTLDEPAQLGGFFVADDGDIAYDNLDKNARKALTKNDGVGVTHLATFRDVLDQQCDPWTGAKAHELLQAYCDERGVGMGVVAQPIRVAVSGSTVTPGIDQTLDILGRDRTLARIDNLLAAHT